jgi:Synergist-CTERM protein sorting domain-containing protein
VTVEGGTFGGATIYGGFAGSGSTTGNVVTLKDGNLTNVDIYGGNKGADNNVLIVDKFAGTIGGVDKFSEYIFVLPEGFSAGESVLTVGKAVRFDAITKIELDPAKNKFKNGEEIILIRGGSGSQYGDIDGKTVEVDDGSNWIAVVSGDVLRARKESDGTTSPDIDNIVSPPPLKIDPNNFSVNEVITVKDKSGNPVKITDIINSVKNAAELDKLNNMGLSANVNKDDGTLVVSGTAVDVGLVEIEVNLEGGAKVTIELTVLPLESVGIPPSVLNTENPETWTGTVAGSKNPDGTLGFTLNIPLALSDLELAALRDGKISTEAFVNLTSGKTDEAHLTLDKLKTRGETWVENAYIVTRGETPDIAKDSVDRIGYRIGIHQYDQKSVNVPLIKTGLKGNAGGGVGRSKGSGGCNAGLGAGVLLCAALATALRRKKG